MNQAFFSFLTGLLYTGGLFLICLFAVVGAKVVLTTLFSPKAQEKPVQDKPEPPKEKPKVKSIEINADQVDKIYFKKSS